MTVVAAIEAVAIVAVVFLFLRHIRNIERDSADERRVLANRIQHPQLIHAREAPAFVEPPAREDDQLSMVGKIRISDKYGIDDGS